MKENASGNKKPSSTASSDVEDLPVGIPEGEELTIDPDSGELIDPVDRWWDVGNNKEEGAANRKVDPAEKKQPGEEAELTPTGEEKQEEESSDTPGEEEQFSLEDVKEAGAPVAEKQGPPALPPVLPDLSEETKEEDVESAEPSAEIELPKEDDDSAGADRERKDAGLTKPPSLPPKIPVLPEIPSEEETPDDEAKELSGDQEPSGKAEGEKDSSGGNKPPALPPALPGLPEPPVEGEKEAAEESPEDGPKNEPEEVSKAPEEVEKVEEEEMDAPMPLFLFEDEEQKKEEKKAGSDEEFLDLLDEPEGKEKIEDSSPEEIESESPETIEISSEKEDKLEKAAIPEKERGKKPPVLPAPPVVEEIEDNTLDGLISKEKEEVPPEKETEAKENADEEEEASKDLPESDDGGKKEEKPGEGDLSSKVESPAPDESEEEKDAGAAAVDDAAGETAPAATEEEAPRKKAGCWTVFTSLFFFASLLVVVLVAVAGFVAWSKIDGIRGDLEGRARTELAKRGIYFDYESWKYEFPRGLVLENVKLYQTEKKEHLVVSASNFGLNVDFVGLARGTAQSRTGEVTFDDAAISLYDGGKLLTTLTEVDGEILASDDTVEVERLNTLVNGLRVEVSGRVDLDGKEKKTSPGPDNAAKEGDGESSMLAMDFSPLQKLAEIPVFETEGEPPVLSVEFAAKASEGPTELKGTLNGTGFTWNGIPFSMVSALVDYDPVLGLAKVPNFQLGYGDGVIGGTFDADIAGKNLSIHRANSTVDLLALLVALKPELAGDLSHLEFLDAPSITMKGTVPFEATMENADLEFDYHHNLGLLIHMGERVLPLKDIRGTIRLSKGSLESNDFAADLLGGIVEVNGATRLTAEGHPFSGLIDVSKLPLENLGAFFGKPDSGMSGDVYFNFRGVGYTTVEKIRGGGNLRIEQAELRSFPVVGPVQQLLGRVVPAFGLDGKGAVSGSYLIDSGMLLTNDLTVSQSGARIVTNGSLMLSSQEVDFTTTASLEDALAAATGMQEKAITVKGKGSLYEPELTLEDFPKEFAADALSEVLGTSPKTLERLKEIMPDSAVLEEIGNTLDEAVGEELGNEVRSILRAIPTPEE